MFCTVHDTYDIRPGEDTPVFADRRHYTHTVWYTITRCKRGHQSQKTRRPLSSNRRRVLNLIRRTSGAKVSEPRNDWSVECFSPCAHFHRYEQECTLTRRRRYNKPITLSVNVLWLMACVHVECRITDCQGARRRQYVL